MSARVLCVVLLPCVITSLACGGFGSSDVAPPDLSSRMVAHGYATEACYSEADAYGSIDGCTAHRDGFVHRVTFYEMASTADARDYADETLWPAEVTTRYGRTVVTVDAYDPGRAAGILDSIMKHGDIGNDEGWLRSEFAAYGFSTVDCNREWFEVETQVECLFEKEGSYARAYLDVESRHRGRYEVDYDLTTGAAWAYQGGAMLEVELGTPAMASRAAIHALTATGPGGVARLGR